MIVRVIYCARQSQSNNLWNYPRHHNHSTPSYSGTYGRDLTPNTRYESHKGGYAHHSYGNSAHMSDPLFHFLMKKMNMIEGGEWLAHFNKKRMKNYMKCGKYAKNYERTLHTFAFNKGNKCIYPIWA